MTLLFWCESTSSSLQTTLKKMAAQSNSALIFYEEIFDVKIGLLFYGIRMAVTAHWSSAAAIFRHVAIIEDVGW